MDSLVKWIPLPPELVYALVHQNALLVCGHCQLWQHRQPQPCADCGVDNLYCTSCVKQCEAGCCYYCPTCAPKRSSCLYDDYVIPMEVYTCSHKVVVTPCHINNKACVRCCESRDCFVCGKDVCCKHYFITEPYPEDDDDWWPEVVCTNCYYRGT